MKIKVTNIVFDPKIPAGSGGGGRGVNTVNGRVMLEPGQSAEVEMTKAEIASSERTGWFHFGENPPPRPAYADKSMAERQVERII